MRRSVAVLSALFASTLMAAGATVPASAAVAAPTASISQQVSSAIGTWKVDREHTTLPAILAYDIPMSMDIAENFEFETRVGCNMVFGSVTFAPQDGVAQFSAVGSTQMECEPVAMAAEMALKNLLDHATLTYELTDTTLRFVDDEGMVLAFNR